METRYESGSIKESLKALKAELRELQVAKAALDGQAAPVNILIGSAAAPTIKDMAREVLSGMPNGLNSSGILDAIKKKFGRDVERTSLSPQLSRMKEDGELFLSGEVWFTKANYAIWQENVFNKAGEAFGQWAEQAAEEPPGPSEPPEEPDDPREEEDCPF